MVEQIPEKERVRIWKGRAASDTSESSLDIDVPPDASDERLQLIQDVRGAEGFAQARLKSKLERSHPWVAAGTTNAPPDQAEGFESRIEPGGRRISGLYDREADEQAGAGNPDEGGDGAGAGGQDFIEFVYANPDVTVDSSARYKEHDIIGGDTVRQKLGGDPTEIRLTGIATEGEAQFLDSLYQTDFVRLRARRWSGYAQVDAANTNPISQGGAIGFEYNEAFDEYIENESYPVTWTHGFEIQLTSVDLPEQ